MPRVIKSYTQNMLPETKAYHFVDLDSEFAEGVYGLTREGGTALDSDNITVVDKAEEILEEARINAKKEAEKIISEARKDAKNEFAKAKENGYKEGFSKGESSGYKDGYEKSFDIAKNEALTEVRFKYDELLYDLKTTIDAINIEKSTFISKYKDDLTRLALTIAEKIIDVSLSTSTEVIERMITKSLDECKDNEKVKIYISEFQAELITKSDKNILGIIENISKNVKIEVLNDFDNGTCIVEFADKIIDSSVKTQIDNMKEAIFEIN